jgi:hypothetical protein
MTMLSERAMLANLHMGSYSGMMFDREVTDEISEYYKADIKTAGRYNKRLVAPQFLSSVGSAQSNARKIHKVLTLPWDDDGTRILTTAAFMQYQSKLREAKVKVDVEVKRFIDELPSAIDEARGRLKDMFRIEDYPTAEELAAKFTFDIEYRNLPEAGDFRAKLSDDATKAVVKDIERRCNQRLENAMNDVFERVYKLVKHMVDRLREYQPSDNGKRASGIIRDSVIYNIHELAEIMPTLNFTEDPRIEKLRQQLLDELVEPASPEILRSDAKSRQLAITNAEKILKKVGGYLK